MIARTMIKAEIDVPEEFEEENVLKG